MSSSCVAAVWTTASAAGRRLGERLRRPQVGAHRLDAAALERGDALVRASRAGHLVPGARQRLGDAPPMYPVAPVTSTLIRGVSHRG